MIKIRLFTKEGLTSGEFEELEYHKSIGEWAFDHYNNNITGFSIYKGLPNKSSDITFDADECCTFIDNQEYTVLETPTAALGVAGVVSIISAVISVAAIVYARRLAKNMPDNVVRNQESPNNSLSSRSNKARPLQRIPDIKGKVLSVPDVLTLTYTKYQNQQTKVEYGYYCVGRKQIDVQNIKDGDTRIKNIEGASAQVYYPFKSPNNTTTPDAQVGDYIDEPIASVYRSSEIDNVELPANDRVGNQPLVIDNGGVIPAPTGEIFGYITTIDIPNRTFILTLQKYGGVDWLSPDYYEGNTVYLTNYLVQELPTPSTIYDMSGSGLITKVDHVSGSDSYDITLKSIDITIPVFVGIMIGYVMPDAYSTTDFSTPYNQWYYMTKTEFNRGFVNIGAPNGLYYDSGTGSLGTVYVNFIIEVEGVDENGVPDGYPQYISDTLSGNSSITRGKTLSFDFTTPTSFRIRVKRTTEHWSEVSTQFSQDIFIEDIYGVEDLEVDNFGDVTTIQTKTIYNASSASLKERQLSCQATEMLYAYLGDSVFDTALTTNENAIQSFITDWIDPKMGNQSIDDLDPDELLALNDEILSYFGSDSTVRFDYTLDSTDITFMEYTQMLFDCINCHPYRDGSKMRVKFEKLELLPTTVFTHRSKKPDSEVYTRKLESSQLNDGVQLIYVDPIRNTSETIYLPDDRSSVKPRKIELPGMRDKDAAIIRAYREYNKLRLNKIGLELTTTGDARFLVPNDMVSVVKGTRTKTYDGEITSVGPDGKTLTLSNDVEFTGSGPWSMILKYNSSDIESIQCTAGTESNMVILDDLPSQTIITDVFNYQRRTEFSFGSDELLNTQKFLVKTISITDHHEIKLEMVNYDDGFYANDDYILTHPSFDTGFNFGFQS